MPERENAPRSPLVLIANDQEWSARSLESILVPNGYTVIRAYTGQQALERALSARPDLIILDAQMPDVHGIEVCRLLREDPRFSATVPILITTAGPSGRVQRLDAYRAGAWEFLGQPLDGESLLLKLGTYLAAKRDADRTRDESLLDHDTGLYNMRGLSRRAREIGSEVYRRRQPLACLVLAAESLDADVSTQQRLTGELGRPITVLAGRLFGGPGFWCGRHRRGGIAAAGNHRASRAARCRQRGANQALSARHRPGRLDDHACGSPGAPAAAVS
jgi:CheY-like chemotaxis protein